MINRYSGQGIAVLKYASLKVVKIDLAVRANGVHNHALAGLDPEPGATELASATDDRRRGTSLVDNSCCVSWAVNSGPPSEDSSFAMPHVTKILERHFTRPEEPSRDCCIFSQ